MPRWTLQASMKVLLINPPKTNAVRSEVPAVVREEGGKYPPLGLMYVQAYMKAHTDFEVELLDADANGLDYPGLEEEVKGKEPDLVGVTALTHNLVDVVQTVAAVRRARPQAHINLGGPHVNAFPREASRIEALDSLTVGDGEAAFTELAQRVAAAKPIETVPGLMVRAASGEWTGVPQAGAIRDIDILPFPDHSADQAKFYNIMGTASAVATMVTSRGCPFRCTFCSTPREHYRERSAASVVDEMAACMEAGVEEIYFVDDTFNVHPERVTAICERIVDRELKVKWSCRLRIDRTTFDLLERMKAAGCTRVQYGVETSTDEGLEVLGKGITVSQVRDVIAWTKKAGIPAVTYFMIGCPHERTRDDVLRTIRFAKELDTDMAMFNVLTPMPGCKLHEQGVARGVLTEQCWQGFFENPAPGFQPEVWEEHLSRAELYELLDAAYRSFYLRPRVILRRLWGLRSWQQLKRQARAAMRMVFGRES